ncbi:Ankyrin repeat domain-containing protein 50-like protein 3 [Colletotrichum sojae]|uniref:Ankyrin repeat domain-containing protein 50-like protein 3 n=1 Tax=Colletotrichum sojae TaxID=2175907 RepID=A0A8H6IYG4_9PEZI|nr:Ankyrin repeat domain-containing protein 50-like protein 3 [Colletotrichum sojae]
MQDFPCLVIRGISDYADSHKNNKWQNYAAVTAAVFAKEILSVIPPARVLQQGTVQQIVSDPVLHGLVTTTTEVITTQTHHQMTRYHNEEEAKCHPSFKTSQYEKFKDINPNRVEGTCRWVLEHPHYERWRESPGDDLLWISADPGCGKSVLARPLIENELRAQNHTVCYFFFKDNEEQDAMSTALCALLHQLFSSQPQLLRHATDFYKKNGGKLQNEAAELWRILIDASRDDGKTKTATCADNEAKTTICVLDALDECASGDLWMLIERLNDFYTHRPSTSTRNMTLKFMVTCRPYQDIATGFSHIPSSLPSIRLAGEESNADISREINLVICDAVERFGQEYQLDGRMQDILRRRLVETPNRTYLWLHLMLEALPDLDKSTSSAFQSDINSLPQSVEEAYERILSRHSGQRLKVEAILHIIVGARRPLKILELYVAYQMTTVTPCPTRHEELELDSAHFKSHVRHLCGLFVFINDERIFLIHQTAKDFPAIMARLCVQYLMFEDIQDNWVSTGSTGEDKGDDNDREYPLSTYSATYWPTHFLYAKSHEGEMDRRIDKLYDMRSKRYETWTTIFWRAHYPHRSQDGIRDVHLAALNGHDEILRRLLGSNKTRLDAQDGDCRTPLLWSSLAGHDVVVQTLLEKHAKVDIQCNSVGTALQAASQGGHTEIVRLLLENGADVNMQSDEFPSALYSASRRGFSEIVVMLLDKGAYVNTQCSETHANNNVTSHVYTGCSFDRDLDDGLFARLKSVLSGIRYVKKPNVSPTNPLLAAVSEGHSNIVLMLLNNGADISTWGSHALLVAISRGA